MSQTWQRPRLYDDPFTSPPYPPKDSAFRWASRVARPSPSSRFSSCRLSPMRMIIFLVAVATVVLIRDHIPNFYRSVIRQHPTSSLPTPPELPFYAFPSPELTPYRLPDRSDTFTTYKHRETCNISSLDLHTPFSPLCADRQAMLTAMASGGRIGNGAPYMPRDCDMRWFTTEEVCEILGRFERVVLVGDSMLRHVVGSLNVLLRRDLGYGAVTDWNFSAMERKQCFCNEQFDVKACSVQGIYSTDDVLKNDPLSLSCSNKINLITFILGHGLWNNLELQKTVSWLDAVLSIIRAEPSSPSPACLFLTPSAAGREKPDEWIVSQGNKALVLFEEATGIEAGKRGVEHLGTWNMSIQARKYDGVHLDMRGNLVKGMMVLNWLDWVGR
ncbi:hypothetical protein HYFRA_00010698 [Hymenoscyphus fraxineus]|uniref:Uncharacterized protein n=1 Tax=Hymenoscyphus fraxineus TaxID=746836 RepID=A0A9N9PVH8_9HELO|nr:hypothetical protein HYFRA_00010698 [Hymenoscyphus fraxineus]